MPVVIGEPADSGFRTAVGRGGIPPVAWPGGAGLRLHGQMMRITERRRLGYLYLREAWRRISRKIAVGHVSAFRFSGGTLARLIVAPTDLRATDTYVAEEILQGRFPLAGRVVECGDSSPFSQELPTRLFAIRLHSFGWLRHIRAAKTDAACAHARAVVDDWISRHGSRIHGIAWEPDVIAQRVIAWLSHSPVVLQDSENGFYRRFLKSLALQVRYLRHVSAYAPDGLPRFRVRIALAMASVSMSTSATTIRRAARDLDFEIERQILGDGTHASRNPQASVELLFDLLPLRQTYINLGHDVPSKLIPAIDRMYPALRFFRHHNGDLALFNGATSTLANELMSVLRYDESAGQPFKSLPHGRYHRLSQGNTVVIMDTGPSPSVDMSRTHHAGCLAFELSSGRNHFIINSGVPRYAGEKLRQMARATAAHSTVTLGDTSICRISQSGFLGPVLASPPFEVTDAREVLPDGSDALRARHEGYLKQFGLIHERELRLAPYGKKILGRDLLLKASGQALDGPPPVEAVARFHVHPAIVLEQFDRHKVRMMATDGESWDFSVSGGTLDIEEDVFFADVAGVRASEQIAVRFSGPEIRWSLIHHA